GTGGAGDEDDARVQRTDIVQLRGKVQVLKRGDFVGDDAHHDCAASALAEDVDTETGGIFQAVGKIGGAFFFQLASGVFVVAQKRFGDLLGVVGHQAFKSLEFQFDEM